MIAKPLVHEGGSGDFIYAGSNAGLNSDPFQFETIRQDIEHLGCLSSLAKAYISRSIPVCRTNTRLLVLRSKALCRASSKEMAQFLGISMVSFERWVAKKSPPLLSDEQELVALEKLYVILQDEITLRRSFLSE